MLEHEHWIQFAKTDLRVAMILLHSDEPTIGPILYHSQQCAEKALKAFLVYKEQDLVKIHDLSQLLKLCSKIDSTFLELRPNAIELTPYAHKTRYPDSCYIMPDLSIAHDAVEQAETILAFVENKTS